MFCPCAPKKSRWLFLLLCIFLNGCIFDDDDNDNNGGNADNGGNGGTTAFVVDNNFGNNGVAIINNLDFTLFSQDRTLNDDLNGGIAFNSLTNNIMVVGRREVERNEKQVLAIELDSAGSLNTAFANNGSKVFSVDSSTDAIANDVKFSPKGLATIVGEADGKGFAVQLDSKGDFFAGFNDGNPVVFENTKCQAVDFDGQGRIFIVGNGGSDLKLISLDADGSVLRETAFDALNGNEKSSDSGVDIFVDEDGKPTMLGESDSVLVVLRTDSSGVKDNSFGVGGVVSLASLGNSMVGGGIEISNGNITVAGTDISGGGSGEGVLSQLSSTGDIVLGFGNNGKANLGAGFVTDLKNDQNGESIISQEDKFISIKNFSSTGQERFDLLFSENISGGDNEEVNNSALTIDNNNNILVSGRVKSSVTEDQGDDIFVTRLKQQ